MYDTRLALRARPLDELRGARDALLLKLSECLLKDRRKGPVPVRVVLFEQLDE